jgi:hypothetical protein
MAVVVLVATGVLVMTHLTDDARVTFKSCAEAREAGAPLPLHAGDPGWNVNLDDDHDGAAC